MHEEVLPPVIQPVEANQAAIKLAEAIGDHAVRGRAWTELSEFQKDILQNGEMARASLQKALAEVRSAIADRGFSDKEELMIGVPSPFGAPLAIGEQAWNRLGKWLSLLWVAGLAVFGAFAGAIVKSLGDGLGAIIKEWFAVDDWKDRVAEKRRQRAQMKAVTNPLATSVLVTDSTNLLSTPASTSESPQETSCAS